MLYKRYDIELAGKVITGEFRYPETAFKFGKYCIGLSDQPEGIRVPDYELETWKSFGNESGPQFEFSCFTAVASEALSSDKRVIVHAVAFSFRDGAYLIAAPSGEGKSTMIKMLQESYPGDFSVICGDRPVLLFSEENAITVYPSPWNGKENWYGAAERPLRGIIFLKRDSMNELSLLKKGEAAVSMYNSLIQTRDSAAMIHRFAEFATAILDSVPAYRLHSRETKETAPLLYAMLNKAEDVK